MVAAEGAAAAAGTESVVAAGRTVPASPAAAVAVRVVVVVVLMLVLVATPAAVVVPVPVPVVVVLSVVVMVVRLVVLGLVVDEVALVRIAWSVGRGRREEPPLRLVEGLLPRLSRRRQSSQVRRVRLAELEVALRPGARKQVGLDEHPADAVQVPGHALHIGHVH